jgi:uncharacterized protein YbjT (DUF2867 family)
LKATLKAGAAFKQDFMRVLLFGASGHLGRAIARAVVEAGHELTVVVRSRQKAAVFNMLSCQTQIIPHIDRTTLEGSCAPFEVVISALGKSVSPNDRSHPGFVEVDLQTNTLILEEAVRARVRQFIYVSAFGAERYPQLTYFRVHEEMARRVMASGIPYLIVKPPALFSAFLDLVELARKGRLMTIGTGRHLTNPIHEEDLASLLVEGIGGNSAVLEAGGPEALSRNRINEIIQEEVAPDKKVRRIPVLLVKSALPLLRIVDRNLYDKISFFLAVLEEEVLAPKKGEQLLREYVRKAIMGEKKMEPGEMISSLNRPV